MKISRLHIEDYKHLENLEFDFTYPEDYKDKTKAGKPLDKVCFIGQSATGKTTLLELLKENYENLKEVYFNNSGNNFHFDKNIKPTLSKTFFLNNGDYINLSHKKMSVNNVEHTLKLPNGSYSSLNSQLHGLLYYFKANLISEDNIELFTKNPVDLFRIFPELTQLKIDNLGNPIIFDSNVESEIWLSLLKDVLDYRKKFNQKMSELIHKGLIANQKKLSSEFNKWQKDNPNVLEIFANKFNPIIEKLNLEVDVVNTEFSIPILNKKSDEVIPIQDTSTGTKSLLLSFLPLLQLDTKDSIILIDEPERSLYPDMQMDLIEHYTKIAPEAQFFVATHSPFIAASFEPEERFILYFDNEGNVKVKQGKSPIGDDPNDVLKNDFGVNYYNKHGEAAYKKYLDLKQAMANEKNEKKKKELLLEMVKLGDDYNF